MDHQTLGGNMGRDTADGAGRSALRRDQRGDFREDAAGATQAGEPNDRTIAGSPMDPCDPALSDQAEMGRASSASTTPGPEAALDPDFVALTPEDGKGKTTAQLYEEGLLQSPGARQYGYAAKIGVLPGFVEGDPEAWRLVMEGRSEWDPREEGNGHET